MRILYDGFTFGAPTGGINRYFANLISRLPEDFAPCLTAPRIARNYFPTHPKLRTIQYCRFRPRRVSRRLEKLYFRAAVGAQRFELAHPTYYQLLTQQRLADYRWPKVITVYDMIHELFQEQMDPERKCACDKSHAVAAADRIICISESTRQDLIRIYRVPEEKIRVVHLATEMSVEQSFGQEPVPSRPYFLYVGARNSGYKNFDGLVKAFARLAAKRPEALLCVVGPPLVAEEQQLLESLRVTDRVQQFGQTSDSHLAKLYRSSIALVYPSLYEGFGIPLLEAMACGTAVIAADSSSIPEVVGRAGVLFHPRAIDDLAAILLRFYDQPGEREALIALGHDQVKRFSWEKTARETVDVYKSLVNCG